KASAIFSASVVGWPCIAVWAVTDDAVNAQSTARISFISTLQANWCAHETCGPPGLKHPRPVLFDIRGGICNACCWHDAALHNMDRRPGEPGGRLLRRPAFPTWAR